MTADGKEKTARTGTKVQAVVATAAAVRAPDKGKVPAGGRGIDPAAVCKAAYIYLTLPLLIFLAGWLDYGWAALFLPLTALAFYKIYTAAPTGTPACGQEQRIPRGAVFSLLLLAAGWCFFAGIGYFYYQSFDYHSAMRFFGI